MQHGASALLCSIGEVDRDCLGSDSVERAWVKVMCSVRCMVRIGLWLYSGSSSNAKEL